MTVKVNSINILANNVKTFALDISFICYFVHYYILSTPLILGLASDHVFVSEAYGIASHMQLYCKYTTHISYGCYISSSIIPKSETSTEKPSETPSEPSPEPSPEPPSEIVSTAIYVFFAVFVLIVEAGVGVE